MENFRILVRFRNGQQTSHFSKRIRFMIFFIQIAKMTKAFSPTPIFLQLNSATSVKLLQNTENLCTSNSILWMSTASMNSLTLTNHWRWCTSPLRLSPPSVSETSIPRATARDFSALSFFFLAYQYFLISWGFLTKLLFKLIH